MINTWPELLESLKESKKHECKKLIKLSARSLYTMLYSGHFDSLFDKPPTAAEYDVLSVQLAKALGSHAQLPKKTKTQKYGIDDIRGRSLILHMWRKQVNPIYSFDFMSFLKNQLIDDQKFQFNTKSKKVPYTKEMGKGDYKIKLHLWRSYRLLEQDKAAQEMYKDAEGTKLPCFVGVITDVIKFKYGLEKEKEAMKFKLFVGEGSTTDIMIWPKNDSLTVAESLKQAVKEGVLAIVNTRCGEYKGSLSLTFKGMTLLEYKG